MSEITKPLFPMRPARELMIPLDSYPSIQESTSLADAIVTFCDSHIDRKGKLSLPRILLVFDEQEKLTGVVRRRDIICGLLPSYMTDQKEPHAESHYDLNPAPNVDLAELMKDKEHKVLSANAQTPVTDIMQATTIAVNADDDVLDLIMQIARTRSHMLPVMENDHVIGVVRTVELLGQIRRLLEL